MAAAEAEQLGHLVEQDDEADDHAQGNRPGKVDIGKHQRERQGAVIDVGAGDRTRRAGAAECLAGAGTRHPARVEAEAALVGLADTEVKEARDGDLVVPGRALIAPGDRHLRIKRLPLGTIAVLSDTAAVAPLSEEVLVSAQTTTCLEV